MPKEPDNKDRLINGCVGPELPHPDHFPESQHLCVEPLSLSREFFVRHRLQSYRGRHWFG